MLYSLVFATFACRDESPTPQNTAHIALTVHDLIGAADTLPRAAVFARVTQLPHPYQDSFFIKRLFALELRDDHEQLRTTVEDYQQARPGLPLMLASTQYQQGVMHQFAGRFDAADSCYAIAEKHYTLLGDKAGLAHTLDSYSGCLGVRGKYDEGIAMKHRAISLCNEIGDRKYAFEIQATMANQFNGKADFDKAIELLKEPLAYFEQVKDNSNMAYALGIIGTAYNSKKDFQRGLEYHTRALSIRRITGPPSTVMEQLYHCGRSLTKLGKWQDALDTFRLVENLTQNSPNKQILPFINLGMGEALFNLNHHQEAGRYLIASLEISTKRKQYPACMMASRMMCVIQKEKKQFVEALHYHEQYAMFKDSLFSQEKDKISRELNVKYETHEKEQQIIALKKENALALQRNLQIAGLMFLLAGIILYFFHLRSRFRRKHLETTLEKQRVELDSNQTLLNDYAQRLLDRNRIIEGLSVQNKNNQRMENEADVPIINPNNTTQLYHWGVEESDWDVLQQRFHKVYPEFINDIKRQLSTATPGELRLLMLAKMSLSLKESAILLGINTNSVKMGRYRLRKKLQDAGVQFE